jgi:hypothetical protein
MTSKLDEMLAAWPLAKSPQLEADEAAERVVRAVQAGQLPASIDESLLASPLPKTSEDQDSQHSTQSLSSRPRLGSATPGIGVETKMAKDRTRDRTSFQELAKLATTPPPPISVGVGSEKSGPHAPIPPSASSSGSAGVVRGEEAQSSDSGIVDLKAIANADPTGSHRAQTTPLASQGLFDEDESAPAKPAVSEKAAAKLAPASDGKAVASAVAQPAAASVKKAADTKSAAEKNGGGGIVIVLGALVAAGAIAAGVFFFVKSQHRPSTVAQTTIQAVDQGPKVKGSTKATPAGAVSVAQADTDLDTVVDPNTPQTGGQRPTFKFHSKPGAGGGAAAVIPEPTTAGGGVDPKLIANVPTGPVGGGSGDLAEAMKTAAGGGTGLGQGVVGGGGAGPTNQGNVAQRPSQGQVAGAINSVMPTVRACLGSDDPVSHATVTLQSDGTVKSVSVTGFAAGKPQEGCIKGALTKMTVSPFAEATYPVPVTIRPN